MGLELLINFFHTCDRYLVNLATEVPLLTEIKLSIVLMLDMVEFLDTMVLLQFLNLFIHLDDSDLMEVASTLDDWDFLDTSVHNYVIVTTKNYVEFRRNFS